MKEIRAFMTEYGRIFEDRSAAEENEMKAELVGYFDDVLGWGLKGSQEAAEALIENKQKILAILTQFDTKGPANG